MTNRFEVTRISESNNNQSNETIPLIRIENELSPSTTTTTTTNDTNKNRFASHLLNSIFQRKYPDVHRRSSGRASPANNQNKMKKNFSAENIKTMITSKRDSTTENEIEDSDVYSTVQSNQFQTGNKFLQELRSKCREIREKSENHSIEQRIAYHRQQRRRRIVRAQDIFDVRFELNEDDEDQTLIETNLLDEEHQEKVRNDIYDELNRREIKKHYKRHQQVFLGRALLMIMISLFAMMSFILIYVVLDFYSRAKYLNAKLPDNQFISMIYDKKID